MKTSSKCQLQTISKKLIESILIIIVCVACGSKKNPSVTLATLPVDTSNNVKVKPSKLDGYWILTDYFDNVLKDKTISKHRLYRISWSTMAFTLRGDNMSSIGLIQPKKMSKIKLESDSLCSIEGFGTFVLRYNEQMDNIEATNIAPEKTDKYKSKVFTYRRVTESRLQNIIDGKNQMEIRSGFNALFVDSLIGGEYKSLDNGPTLILTSTGLTNGFKEYNKYDIHDYFGTSHPYENYDAICFTDTINQNSKCYNWVFKGETLILTEMVKDNNDQYHIGKVVYKFVRTRKNSG